MKNTIEKYMKKKISDLNKENQLKMNNPQINPAPQQIKFNNYEELRKTWNNFKI